MAEEGTLAGFDNLSSDAFIEAMTSQVNSEIANQSVEKSADQQAQELIDLANGQPPAPIPAAKAPIVPEVAPVVLR